MTNIYELGYGLGKESQERQQEAEKLGKQLSRHLESEERNPSSETYDPKAKLAEKFRDKMSRDRQEEGHELER